MSKGELTRELILRRTAPLFNQQGYFGASLADVMQATGLEKGGIYNHFGSKEQLALEAFDYAVAEVEQRFWHAIDAADHAVDKLLAVVTVFSAFCRSWSDPRSLRQRCRCGCRSWYSPQGCRRVAVAARTRTAPRTTVAAAACSRPLARRWW